MQPNQFPPDDLIVGITGHRFLDNPEKITSLLNLAFDSIQMHFPEQKVHLLTPLAEGADRLAAQICFDRPNAAFSAILPMPTKQYLRDFSNRSSQQQFKRLLEQADQIIELSQPADPDKVYMQVGDFILRHCELLLAVWDGHPAKGVGGTGDIVELARRRRLPVIWISTHAQSSDSSALTLERLPNPTLPSET